MCHMRNIYPDIVGYSRLMWSPAIFSVVPRGALKTPCSVMIPPVIRSYGVTSKAGFQMSMPETKGFFFFLRTIFKKKTQHNKAAKERKWGV
jgi:hypothetical protein